MSRKFNAGLPKGHGDPPTSIEYRGSSPLNTTTLIEPLTVERIFVRRPIHDVEPGSRSKADGAQRRENMTKVGQIVNHSTAEPEVNQLENTPGHVEAVTLNSALFQKKIEQQFDPSNFEALELIELDHADIIRSRRREEAQQADEVRIQPSPDAKHVQEEAENQERPNDNQHRVDNIHVDVPCELDTFPNYLQTHFTILYYMGLSPIRGDGSPGSNTQSVAFTTLSVIGVCHFLAQCKHYILEDAKVGDLENYLMVWYLMCCLFVQLGILKLFIFDRERIQKILRCPATDANALFQPTAQKFAWEPILAASVTLIVSVIVVIRPDWIYEGLTPKDVFLSRSWGVSCYIFAWGNDNNQTALLEEQYGSELNPTTIILGLTGTTMRFVGNMKEHLIRDILLMSALHANKLSHVFQVSILKKLEVEGATDQSLDNMKSIHEDLLKMADILNGFRAFFKVVHIESWMVCQYFLVNILRGDVRNVYSLMAFIFVPKIILAYCVCAEAIVKSQGTKHMIEKEYNNKKPHEVDKAGVLLFLNILNEHPIGIGRGQFQLDEAFVQKFIGVVVSCFLLYEDPDKNKSG